MPSEQVDQIRVLAKRVREIAKDHGMKLLNFSLVPSLDEAPDSVTLVMEFDPDGVKEPEVVIQQADQALVDAMEEARRDELERKRLKAREDLENLEDRMKGRQGFLDDFMDD